MLQRVGPIPLTAAHYPAGLARLFPRRLSDNLMITQETIAGRGRTMTRALFVNSGMPGHRSFAGLMTDCARVPGLEARHVNPSCDLTATDRVLRKLFSLQLTPSTGGGQSDSRRWRQEWNVGLLAARRIASAERETRFDVLHFHTQITAYASLARMRQSPSIVSFDCTQHQASLEAESRLARATYRASIAHDGRVFRAASAIVGTSRWAARDLAASYPDCAQKVRVLPFPVDVDAFGRDWARDAPRARCRAAIARG